MIHDPQDTPETPEGQGGERIAKAMARAGVASRREVERLIEAGRVFVNGVQVTTPATKVEADDVLTVDGALVQAAEPARLFRYHKPVGLVTTHKDTQERPTVFDALPKALPRLISVGRLDLNSEGLLLLTNDGGLARALELPASAIVRRYRARARGRVTQEKLDSLKNGVTVEGVSYGAIEAHLDKAKEGVQGANVWITVTLAEGKNREVRRVLEALGLTVNRLIRMSYGPLALGTLAVGEIEEVGPRVIREQFADHIAPGNLPNGDRAQFSKPIATHAGGDVQRRGRTAPGAGHHTGPDDGMPGKPKTVYKAGWAKPTITPSPHPKRKAKPRPAGPVAQVRPAAIPARAPRSDARLAAQRTAPRPRPDAPRSDAPRPDRFKGPRADAPRPQAARPEPTETRAPRRDARSSEAPRPDRGPRADAPRSGPRPNAAKPDVTPKRKEGPKADSRRPDRFKGPRPDGGKTPRPAAHDAPREPKRSESRPAAGRPSGPRGQSPSPSRPQSSPARRPGPPPKGGPKRRG